MGDLAPCARASRAAPISSRAGGRHPLPYTLAPGEQTRLDLDFHLLPARAAGPWLLGLVNEGMFWFFERGSPAAPVLFNPPA